MITHTGIQNLLRVHRQIAKRGKVDRLKETLADWNQTGAFPERELHAYRIALLIVHEIEAGWHGHENDLALVKLSAEMEAMS